MKGEPYSKFYQWLATHRPLVLGATVLIAAVGVLISTRLDLEEDILAILPRKDPMVEDYKYTVRKFRQIDRVYIDVGINRDDPEALGQAADEVGGSLATNPAYARITYRLELAGQSNIVSLLTGALPNLFTPGDAQALAARLDPDKVRSYLAGMRSQLSGFQGMAVKDVLPFDPIGMSALVLAKVRPLLNGFGSAQMVDGRITSGNGRHVLILAEPKFSSSNARQSVDLVAQLMNEASKVERQFPGVHVAVTGGHRMSVDNAALIKADARRCILLGMGAMLVLCLTAYRRRWLAVLTFLPSFFGTLIAGVVLALWQPHLSAISIGFASIAIGITVDYAIYVIYHLDNAAGLDQKGVGLHVGRLVLPISVGALTTIAAFVVMMTSPMHGYQQLGMFGAVGVLVSAAFALIILPLLVPIPKQSGQPPLWLTRWMEKFFDWRGRHLKWLLLGALAVTVVTAFGARKLKFEGDIRRLNGITESTRQDEALITKTWGDALQMTLVVARGKTMEDALEQNDRASEALSHDAHVKEFYSLAAICPSRATQEANINRWHEFWSAPRKESLRQTLQQVGGEMGFRPEAFDEFWKRLESNPAILTLDDFRGTPLAQALSERVAASPGDNAVSIMLKLDERSNVENLRRSLPRVIVLDGQDFAQHIAALARQGLSHFALWTALLVAVILQVSFASIELVLATLTPLAFGLLWTFGLMGMVGLPIDLMNSVFVIFIIGVGEDYVLFLVTSRLDEWRGRPRRLGATSASVTISALTTLFGFAVLAFAKHPVLFSLGTTVLLGMLCTFAATLLITPLCMDLLLYRDPPRGAPKWWHVLGTGWVVLHLGGSELFLYYVLRPILKVISPATADDRLRRATRWMARGVVKGMPFGRLEFQNVSPDSFNPPCVVISNHQSAVDVMLVVSLPGDVRQTAKQRVFDTPTLGIGCKLLGHVLVEPKDPKTTLRRCQERLASGASVHFYPEGTRSHDGFIQRFHLGAFELAVDLRQEILPLVLCDTATAMPRDAYWFEPYHVTVRALPRVTPANFDYSRGSQALRQHCESLVREGLQKQLDEINTPAILRRKVERLYRYQGISIEQFAHWKMKLDPIFAKLGEVIPSEGFVLDLGCGYGLMTHWLAFGTDRRSFLGVDFDEDKIRVAQRTAPNHPRVRFEQRDILSWDYPPCDVVLLMDVLHYWAPEKQRELLRKARQALRPGGCLLLRAGARAETEAHRRVHRWEVIATRIGHNRIGDGLNFRTLEEMTTDLKEAGFERWEIRRDAGRDSNVLLIARVAAR